MSDKMMDMLASEVFYREGKAYTRVSVVRVPMPKVKKATDVLVRVEAAAVNPSDLGVMLPGVSAKYLADAREETGPDGRTCVVVPLSPAVGNSLKNRVGKPLPCGNEGAGTVIATGSAPAASALLGRRVGILGKTYSEYRVVNVRDVLPLAPGTSAVSGASPFVNPTTVIGIIETAKKEGFAGLVHTAAASQLGQMLVRACAKEGMPLVNVVRRDEQVALLRSMGAKYIVNQSSPTFKKDLTAAIAETKAFVAFDATGGGKLASDIFECMEVAANRNSKTYSVYGSDQQKCVYIYGSLDSSPTSLSRNFGFTWKLSAWLLIPSYLSKLPPAEVLAVQKRIANELDTTFATTYHSHVSLVEAARLNTIRQYFEKGTAKKFLITPSPPAAAPKL